MYRGNMAFFIAITMNVTFSIEGLLFISSEPRFIKFLNFKSIYLLIH